MASFGGDHGQPTLPLPVLDDLDGQIPELLLGQNILVNGDVGQQLLVTLWAEDWGPLPLPSDWGRRRNGVEDLLVHLEGMLATMASNIIIWLHNS